MARTSVPPHTFMVAHAHALADRLERNLPPRLRSPSGYVVSFVTPARAPCRGLFSEQPSSGAGEGGLLALSRHEKKDGCRGARPSLQHCISLGSDICLLHNRQQPFCIRSL